MAIFSTLFFNDTNGQTMLAHAVSITASTYTVDSGSRPDYILLCNYAGAITITLPVPSMARIIKIKDASGNAGTNNITISHHASETIDGASTFIITNNFESIDVVSDGTNWFIM